MVDPSYPTYRDQLLTCEVCGVQWIWTVTEQRRIAQQTGETYPPAPSRCPTCQLLAAPPGYERAIVKWYSEQKGYGFLTLSSGQELFFHRSGITDEEIPRTGDLVQFQIEQTQRGPQAVSVTIVKRAAELDLHHS
ncbi:MAG: hypothetical protein Kow0047_30870 [Anaerolineae bacterium]